CARGHGSAYDNFFDYW
nr:immunoglobulin heavy chain junction region [Macaca mulatta]